MVGEIGKFAVQDVAKKAEALSAASSSNDAHGRKRVAQEFASFLFLEVLKAMRAALPQGGFLEGESLSRDIYTSMMDAEIARVMARRDGTGLSQMVEKSLERKAPATTQPTGSQVPAPGVVSSAFGERKHPITGNPQFHKGVDIAAPGGTPVKTMASGKVVFSGWRDGYGTLVEVDHGAGTITRYGHNAVNLVAVGDTVQSGQTIALVGNTGHSTDNHLHFEVRKYGKAVNPESIVGRLTRGVTLKAKI